MGHFEEFLSHLFHSGLYRSDLWQLALAQPSINYKANGLASKQRKAFFCCPFVQSLQQSTQDSDIIKATLLQIRTLQE